MLLKEDLKKAALDYHATSPAGKLGICITKPTKTQTDLSLAYTPGVAEPVKQIHQNSEEVYKYTAKGNLVAVVTNGSAVLGLGNVGALAAKPVMEGKAALFKSFADIDVFDIEIDTHNPQEFINTVARISPTFGGINLEDIKAPECFEIEQALREQLNIPVFHDDQHGTAITISAGLLNALDIQGKSLSEVNIVCVGAGAAGIASMRLLTVLGAKKENICLVDSRGIVHTDRTDLTAHKLAFAIDTDKRTLADALVGADVFIGVARKDLLDQAMLATMAKRPIVFALSNPVPEILPELAYAARPDILMATGRSDYPNQINNVLCFPYIFRGALDVRAHCINDEMLIAAVHAISNLAKEPVPEAVLEAYGNVSKFEFGPYYVLPKPLDLRLRTIVSKAVAEAAIATGVASLPAR